MPPPWPQAQRAAASAASNAALGSGGDVAAAVEWREQVVAHVLERLHGVLETRLKALRQRDAPLSIRDALGGRWSCAEARRWRSDMAQSDGLVAVSDEEARPSLIPSLRTPFTRAGIEWRR